MDESVLKRSLPYNLAAEQSVIGSMILSFDAIQTVKEILTGDDFYQPQYKAIYNAITELSDSSGRPVDIVTLQNKLKESNASPELYSIEYLSGIIESIPSSGNVRSHAEIVRDKSILRSTIKASEEIMNRCYQDNEPVDAIMEDADIVMFLYRDEVYNPSEDNKGKAELIIGKHRNGEIGTVELAWLGQYTRYTNAQFSSRNDNNAVE